MDESNTSPLSSPPSAFSHVDEELLEKYFNLTLDEEVNVVIEEHLGGCSTCSRQADLVAQGAEISAALKRLSPCSLRAKLSKDFRTPGTGMVVPDLAHLPLPAGHLQTVQHDDTADDFESRPRKAAPKASWFRMERVWPSFQGSRLAFAGSVGLILLLVAGSLTVLKTLNDREARLARLEVENRNLSHQLEQAKSEKERLLAEGSGRQLEPGRKEPTFLAKLIDTTGSVLLQSDGQLQFPGNAAPTPDVAGKIKELLTKHEVDQGRGIQLAMAQVRSDTLLRARDTTDDSAPVPLSPAATAIKARRPTFRWRPVSGAQGYRLILADRDQTRIVWEGGAGTSGTFTLPPSVAELPAAAAYSWQIEATINGELKLSNWERFYVLDEEASVQVEVLESRYAASAFALVAIYEAYGLYDAAQSQLERIRALNPSDSQVDKMIRLLQHRRTK